MNRPRSNDDPGDPKRQLLWQHSRQRRQPPVWNVNAGGQVAVQLTNNGTTQHNWAVIKMDAEMPATFDSAANADLILHETGLVDAGSDFRETFVAPTEPGDYLVICTVAGHYPSMQGRLSVQ
ncbi:MAG: hypothetical protein IPJ90_06295 [Anaerolineaceae bacterium]|nr:hypothetical protein [Anaerolineaceae bacterium]